MKKKNILQALLIIAVIAGLFIANHAFLTDSGADDDPVPANGSLEQARVNEPFSGNAVPGPGKNSSLQAVADKTDSKVSGPGWQVGESIKVEISSYNEYLSIDSADREFTYSPDSWTYSAVDYNFFKIRQDNDQYYEQKAEGSASSAYMNYRFRLKTKQSGTLRANFQVAYENTTGSWHSVSVNTSYPVTDDLINAEGYTDFYLRTVMVEVVTIWDVWVFLTATNQTDGTDYQFLYTSIGTWDASWDTATGVRLWLYRLWFTPATVELDVRSEFQQLSADSYLDRVTVENYDYAKKIRLKPDLGWNYSYITPHATVTCSGYDLEITDTVPVMYEIYFTHGPGRGQDYIRQPVYAALVDSSSDYLTQPGFESGWQDWTNGGNGFSSLALDSTIVYSGAFSGKATDTDSSDDWVHYKNIPNSGIKDATAGYIYAGIAYYVQSFSGTGLDFVYYNAGWNFIDLDTSVTDRWIYKFCYFHLKPDSNGRDIAIRFESAQGTVFFDSITFWTSSVTAYSDSSTEGPLTRIIATYRTGFQYGSGTAVADLPVEFDLRCRTTDTSIQTWSTTTGSAGEASVTFQGHLEAKEYEIRSWSYDSWFGSELNGIATETTTGWTKTGFSSGSFSLDSSDKKTGSYSVKLEGTTDSTDNYLSYSLTSNADVSAADYISFYVKVNVTTANPDYHLYMPDYSNRYSLANYETFTADTWELYVDNYIDGSNVAGSPDRTDLDLIRLDFDFSSAVDVTVKIDSLKIIMASKTYFQPLTASHIDYFEITGDAIDFSEGDEEGAVWNNVAGSNAWNSGGYEEATCGTSSYATCSFSGLSIDASYYNYVLVRAYQTSGESMNIGLYDDIAQLGETQTFFDGQWAVYTWDLSDDNDWTGTEIQLKLWFTDSSGNLDGNEAMKFDYIALVHRDSSLNLGWSNEFKEDQEEAENYGGGTVTYNENDEYITVTVTADTNGVIWKREADLTGIDQVWLRMRSSDIASGNLRLLFFEGASYSGPVMTGWTSEWTDLFFDVSNHAARNIVIYCAWFGDFGSFDLAFIRLVSTSPQNLFETSSSFFTSSENDSLLIKAWGNNQFLGSFYDLDQISKNLTAGMNSISYAIYLDIEDAIYKLLAGKPAVYLPSACYYYQYTVTEDGVLKIIIHDQQGNAFDFDRFQVYIDGTRIYDQYLYSSDISETFNLTICDIFGTVLYQDAAETFEQFKEIQLTLYSLKIQNLQGNPIWVQLNRSSASWSEWVFSWEIAEYRLEEDDYDITVYYADSYSNFSVALNSSWVSYTYHVGADTAIRVTGCSIEDVYSNVISLNASLFDRIDLMQANLTFQIDNINDTILEMMGIYRIHVNLVDHLGIGIPWGTFPVNLNGSRQYAQDFYVTNNTNLDIEAFDFFDTKLYDHEFNVTDRLEINITVDLYEVTFRNNHTLFDSIVEISRNGKSFSFEIPAGGSVTRRFTSGKYDIDIYYRVETGQFEERGIDFTEGVHLLSSGKISFGSELDLLGDDEENDNIIDVGAPAIPVILKDAIPSVVAIVAIILAAILSSAATYLIRTRLIEPVDRRIDWKTGREKIQEPIVEATAGILDIAFDDRREQQHRRKDRNRRTAD